MVKVAFYTCLYGDYDDLKDPLIKEGDWFCFTDQKIKSNIWQFLDVPKISEDKARCCRYCKLNPWELLPNYDYYIWQDACCQFLNNKIFNKLKFDLSFFMHAEIKQLFYEIDLIKKLKKDDGDLLDEQFKYYKNQGLPADANLYETTCFIVKNNQRDFFNKWYDEIVKFSKRDQVSLCYLMWKYDKMPNILPGTVYYNPYFSKNNHK